MTGIRSIFWSSNTILAILLTLFLLMLYLNINDRGHILYTIANNNNDYINLHSIKNDVNNDFFIIKRLTPKNNTIFFVESSCAFISRPPNGLNLNSRQACSIYSAAKLNPTSQIILYHSCPLASNFYERSSEFNKQLINLPNFNVMFAKLDDTLKGTIVEHIFDDLRSSSFRLEHTSDIIRLLLVHKYGGTYMDLDFISIKPLESLPINFIAYESESLTSNAVFRFTQFGPGHEFLADMLTDLSTNFDGAKWTANGPDLFKRTYIKSCNLTEVLPKTPFQPCDIKVSNISTFFPVYYLNWEKLFAPEEINLVKENSKESVAIHFWNFLSKGKLVVIGENSPYESLAREFCKEILLNSGNFF